MAHFAALEANLASGMCLRVVCHLIPGAILDLVIIIKLLNVHNLGTDLSNLCDSSIAIQ